MHRLRYRQPPKRCAVAAAFFAALSAACGGEAADATAAAEAARAVAGAVADSLRGEPERCLVVARTLGQPDAAEGEELPWAIYQALITAAVLVDSAGVAARDTSVAILAFDSFLERDSLRIVRATAAASPPGRPMEVRRRRMEWRLGCERGECRIMDAVQHEDTIVPRTSPHATWEPCRR